MSHEPNPQRMTAQLRANIGDHVEGLRDVVETLEPDEVLASQAPALWVAFDRIERLAAAAKILLARRVDDSRVWEHEGHRSAVDYLAEKSGTSKAASRGVLSTSKKITKLASTSGALRRGELSASQVESIADAASHNRDAEEHLLETARTSSLGELRDECARRKAAADPDPDATYRRIHEGRFCRQRRDPEGAWCLTARGTPDAGALFNAALGPIIDEIFTTAWAQGRREEREKYTFDALIELTRRTRNGHAASDNSGETTSGETNTGETTTDTETASNDDGDTAAATHAGGIDAAAASNDNEQSGADDENQSGSRSAKKRHRRRRRRRPDSPTYLALLRIDFTALQRGYTQGDELCEIAGIGPIPVNRARELMSDSIVKLIATRGEQVANVTQVKSCEVQSADRLGVIP
jgi:hypothetical protein